MPYSEECLYSVKLARKELAELVQELGTVLSTGAATTTVRSLLMAFLWQQRLAALRRSLSNGREQMLFRESVAVGNRRSSVQTNVALIRIIYKDPVRTAQ
jgi:pyruvate carboxylase